MRELHLTKKDFKLEWYSGTGKGGQHRNKHQNCCRITHIETGLTGLGTESRERVQNQKMAFKRLAKKIIDHYSVIDNSPRATSDEVIRVYHAVRNQVIDKASGHTELYKHVVVSGNADGVIDARRKAVLGACK